ncbi:MAG TPA: helix-turn-helix domain-containing protein [Acidimicrobiales bacterium]|nr:helix-turn-helix domain-containing protein [Acidimicrobiales bacterium]
MFDDIVGHVPAYQDVITPAEMHDVRSALRRAGGFFLRTLQENRPLDSGEVVALQVIGAQRARHGLPPEGLTAAIQAAMRTGYRRLLECALEVEAPTDVAVRAMGALSMRLFEFVQDATGALVAGYMGEESQRLSSRLREQAALVDRLLEASWTDEDEIRGHAKELGFSVEAPLTLLLVANGRFQETTPLRSAATRLAERLPGAIEGPARPSPVPHVIVVVPEAAAHPWATLLATCDEVAAGEAVYVGCATPVGQLLSLSSAYRRAQGDLLYLSAARTGHGAVAMKDVKAYRILACAPLEDRLDFVRQTLGPIFDLSETKAVELLDTLESLYDNQGHCAAVAGELAVHEKTVRYRLRRVQDLTGLAIDVPADRLQLDMAVRLRRLAMTEVSPFDDPAWGPSSRRRR